MEPKQELNKSEIDELKNNYVLNKLHYTRKYYNLFVKKIIYIPDENKSNNSELGDEYLCLGCFYKYIETNYNLMKKYYIMAIDKGNVDAMFLLAEYYEHKDKKYNFYDYNLYIQNDNYDKYNVYENTKFESRSINSDSGLIYKPGNRLHIDYNHSTLDAISKNLYYISHNLEQYKNLEFSAKRNPKFINGYAYNNNNKFQILNKINSCGVSKYRYTYTTDIDNNKFIRGKPNESKENIILLSNNAKTDKKFIIIDTKLLKGTRITIGELHSFFANIFKPIVNIRDINKIMRIFEYNMKHIIGNIMLCTPTTIIQNKMIEKNKRLKEDEVRERKK
jgi:hypothetical protein